MAQALQRQFFEIYQENQQKWGLKIAFYVDVNVFSLSNLATLKADISKTSSERYRFLFIFVCRTSKYTHMQKIKKFYREVNYVHLALKLAQLRWTGHVIRMPDERLPKTWATSKDSLLSNLWRITGGKALSRWREEPSKPL